MEIRIIIAQTCAHYFHNPTLFFLLQGHIKYENSTTMPDNFITSKVSEMKQLEKKLIEGSFL